jgi:glycosyltransferase involved in cell wall biosynthesis
MIRVAYLFHLDAANPAMQSGRPASILTHLTALDAVVHPVFPLQTRVPIHSTAKKAFYRLLGRFYRGDREPRYLAAAASEFKRRMHGTGFDIAFCPGSEPVSYLDIPQPIAFCADATFANMVDYYWEFTGLSAEYLRKGHLQEANALRRASLAIYPSDWAARSAVDFYRADPTKIFVIPFGANFGASNRREQVLPWIAGRTFETLRLLFVGRDWRRKGGDLVVEAAQHLIARGFQVRLDVVSGELPGRLKKFPWIVPHGLLDPNRPATAATLGELFRKAHFLFVPSRAEAYGMTFAEASAFGLPAIGTATGGITSVIRDAVNGFTLPLSAGASEYADLIAEAVEQRGLYLALCASSFDEFERRLNWRVFCGRFLELAQNCCERLAPRAA